MTVSVPGLGHPLLAILSSKSDIKSILCIFSFCIVILVLAYLTNPSESSFRAYLTELSFRHHLSSLDRLDDVVDDDPFRHVSASSTDTPALLHFATRASVSLRTPKHVFHSFGLFTVATMLPAAKSGQRHDNHLSSIVTDSWYVGAFGKWWRGGIIEAWYQDVVARSKDEESWTSGILSLNNLDMRRDYSGLPLSSHGVTISPPKLRNRERPSHRTSTPPRCNTPPPLPKTASLPLHASRSQINHIDRPPTSQQSMHVKPSSSFERINGLQTLSDLSVRDAELLRQISLAKTSVMDLRTQLSECQNATSQSRTHLQDKVDAHRDRRRQEDAIKVELRSRTKSLDDSKRHAESSKREAEKKLKVARSIHSNATHRLTLLDERISQLQEQMANDRNVVIQRSVQQSPSLRALIDEIELRKHDVKSTEERMAHSSQRVRHLEITLSHGRERLKMLKHRLAARKEIIQRSVGDQNVFFDQGSSMSSPDVADFTPLILEGEEPMEWETCANRYETHSTKPGKFPFALDLRRSSVLSHHQEAMLTDTCVSLLGDCSPCLSLQSDTSGSGEVTSSFVHSVLSSKHTSRNAPCSESFVCQEEDTIPSDSLDDVLSVEPELLSIDGYPPVLPRLFQAGWAPQLGRDYVATGVESGVMQPDRLPFDFTENSRKRLNPDAKEFSLGSRPGSYSTSSHLEASSLYDALDPHGLCTNSASPAATSNPSLLRAFAPSPAERQVLQRALGATSNASLELLPSLGGVGTIPISPSLTTISASKEMSTLNRALPSWLLTPQNHKVNFSPWGDEELEHEVEDL